MSEQVQRIAVYGLWHLGCVTAACLAEAGWATVGIDPDPAVVTQLAAGRAPLLEPGLDPLIAAGAQRGNLSFTIEPGAVAGCQIVWVAVDTPVDDDDRADVDKVLTDVESLFPDLDAGTVVLISSQLPVGSTAILADRFAQARPGITVHFAYSPENLRLGKALDAFRQAERTVVGVGSAAARAVLEPVLSRFAGQLVWVSVASAEMTKHAVNAFLATCVTFANEVARVCERVGADAAEVERALRLEPRIGPKAYIRPGGPFAGGTLARDIGFLGDIAARHEVSIPMLGTVLASNTVQKGWPVARLRAEWGSLAGATVGLLGLAYKVGTSTLRRSWAVELAQALRAEGASVQGFDPAVDEEASGIIRASSAEAVLDASDAAIVVTEWPDFAAIPLESFLRLRRRLVLDPNRHLAARLAALPGLRYVSVGSP